MKTALLGLAALFAGLLTIVVPTTLLDVALGYLELKEPMSNGQSAIAVGYRTLFGILGSYLTARLAPTRPNLLVTVLASLGIVAGTLGAVATWNNPQIGPKWYAIATALIPVPCAWIALKILGRRS